MNFLFTYNLLENMTENSETLNESKRIISDPDTLYHYTNPLPLTKIFKEDQMRADINTAAVCFTTDSNYKIYGLPCCIQVSRKKLIDAGYELELWDDSATDPDYLPPEDAVSESEERVNKTITNISKYTTKIVVDWHHITIIRSKDGNRIADAVYDEHGESECYDLLLDDFLDLLTELENNDIDIEEIGEPRVSSNYYLDSNNKLQRVQPAYV